MRDQDRDIRCTSGQGWHIDREHIQTVEEIGTEGAGLHRRMKITIRGRHDPYIHMCRATAPDPLELPFLQHAQELHLGVQRQLSDFIQEDRSAVGQLEASDATLQRSGERSLLMSEEFALDLKL